MHWRSYLLQKQLSESLWCSGHGSLRRWRNEQKWRLIFLVYSKKIRTHNHTISYILIQLVMHHRKQCFKVQRICIRWSDSVLCTWMGIPYAPAMSQHVSERFGWATMVLLTGVWSGRFDRFRPWTKLTVTLGNVEGLLLRPLFSDYLTRECWIMLNSTISSQYLLFKSFQRELVSWVASFHAVISAAVEAFASLFFHFLDSDSKRLAFACAGICWTCFKFFWRNVGVAQTWLPQRFRL